MAVLLDTTSGNIVIDLYFKEVPNTCRNFLKLCKMKYYNNCLFHNVIKGYSIQSGDPSGTGNGGESIYKNLKGEKYKYFPDEFHPKLLHDKPGVLTMANKGKNTNGSQFIIIMKPIPLLNKKHSVFGQVGEGMNIVEKINNVYTNEENRPYRNNRIRHTHILFDPFIDPKGLIVPSRSPSPCPDQWDIEFLPHYNIDIHKNLEQINQELRNKEDFSRELVLTIVGDKPNVDIKPLDNILFVCKLNPITEDEDLETIFSRFGKILSCEIIRDWKTGDSLSYAFIEYENRETCHKAWIEMDNALIDERRIRVDFSQSVAKMWGVFKRGGDFPFRSKRSFNINRKTKKQK